MQEYSQLRAMLAITKASLRAIFRSPSAVIFSFVFPFIFILVFGFVGNNGGGGVYKIALDKNCDTTNTLFDSLKTSARIRIVYFDNDKELRSSLVKGKITGVLNIQKTKDSIPALTYSIQSTTASNDKLPQLRPVINNIINTISNKQYANRPTYAIEDVERSHLEVIREYKTIDFILPGQLGFSLLSSGVFGVAFMFFSLRNTLVLKRFFATPISRTYIVLGEGLARVLFQMLTAIVIIVAGRFIFGFTLVNGLETVIELLVLSFIGLVVFMGLGFIVSGIAKSESTIPPLANMITLPQFLLGGTFFGVDAFPKWLQPISKMLPLTHLNTAMRAVAFEGQNLWEVKNEIAILLLWGVVVYAVAIKVFKWE
ncbi:ABC transporter permease [Ferruginibacter lapsinanis]|uniref:ABC transporter permease n=1 Tax=Ferruginibacter lapsinanis TaxID=563172 RepID=UPI001E4E18E9|nr:ABC transporter permease [Ferruginibacter lapsinanis]UEG49951.1 ABC transporter permease [Ferruginibacter lapsinanis]